LCYLRGGRFGRIRIVPVCSDGMPGHEQEPIAAPDAKLRTRPAVA
jgi:hypothetical protein